ncbi:metallophosphoesterase family protein [Marinitoga lauensis]|uniref:metallophosphoesterase family protein n=1 Tax=Marinitoga lauensis TaxID=2201189 RepID=UPI00197F3C59|nr:exonuclease SbcCD subunit D [Marinitoga lauensis]
MKILHTSDWHLGRRPVGGIGEYSNIRYEDYFNAAEYIVDIAIEKKIDVFIIAGDLFDRSSLLPDILFKTEKILEKLRNNNIKTLLIEGNHDKIYTHEDSWIKYLENKGLVMVPEFKKENEKYIFTPIKIEDINFYGIPYQGVVIDEVLITLSQQLDRDKKNIIITHTGIGGNFIPGCTKSGIIDFFKDKVLYMAGGHLHSYSQYPKDNPYFFVPGCPEYWDLNENGEKGCIIFDTLTKEHAFFESKKRKLSSYDLIYSDTFFDELNKIQIEKNEIIRLKIINESNKLIENEKIEKILKEKGALKVDILVKYKIEKDFVNSEELDIKDIEKRLLNHGKIYILKMLKKQQNI